MTDDPAALFESNLHSLPLIARGKVRDIYRVDADRLLIVASDRISAFDVVLPDPIPGKGVVLTAISNFWFGKLGEIIANHLTATDPESVVADARDRETVRDRAVVVDALQPLPFEAVVRGYLIGSGWKDYRATGEVSGVELPGGMLLAEQLREPIFTPSTKAAAGDHDENIPMSEVANLVGAQLAEQVRNIALTLYAQGPQSTRASAASSSRIPSSSSASTPMANSGSSTKCSRLIRRGSGPPTATRRAPRRAASTNSMCATISRRSTGTSALRARACPPLSSTVRGASIVRRSTG